MNLRRLLVPAAVAGWLIVSCNDKSRDFAEGTGGNAGTNSAKGGASGSSTAGKGGKAPVGGADDGGAGASGATGPGGEAGSAGAAAGSGGEAGGSCAPDTRRCAGDVPELCDADGAWQATQTGCAFGCIAGACTGCDEGAKTCEGGQAKLCQGGAWQFTPCETLCQEGECVDACTADTRQCEGLDKVQICQDGTFVDETTCPGVCESAACVGVCKPDAARCKPGSTTTAELCSAQGEWVGSACSGSTSVCLDGACVACSPGAMRCSTTGRPQLCTEFGSWADQAPCATAAPTCVEGECQLCEPASRRCNAGRPQQCNATGTAWVDGAACAGATPACVAATGLCGTCGAGDVQCGSATTPQACDMTGKWVDQAACKGTTPACLSGSCVECSPAATRCVGNTPQLCSSNGEWVTQTVCSGLTPQCIAATGACGCAANAVDCLDANTPIVCSSAGAWVQQSDCRGDTPVCSGGSCVCTEGTKECTSSSAGRVCAKGVWKALTCSGATPVCVAGGCGECAPGATRCAIDGSATVDTCTADGVWKRSEACSGICSSGACVNVPCSEEPLLTGAFNFRCRASMIATTPGGNLLAPKDYLLSGWWGTPCTTYDIGSASTFVYQGNTFMRYQWLTRTATTDAGTKATGTFWLQPDAKGGLRRTEMCDPATKGRVTTGTYQQTAKDLTITFADHQEMWDVTPQP